MQARAASYSGGAAYARTQPSTMAADHSAWGTSGEDNVVCLRSTAHAVPAGTCFTTRPRSLVSRFFMDDGTWHNLKGSCKTVQARLASPSVPYHCGLSGDISIRTGYCRCRPYSAPFYLSPERRRTANARVRQSQIQSQRERPLHADSAKNTTVAQGLYATCQPSTRDTATSCSLTNSTIAALSTMRACWSRESWETSTSSTAT
jgi:hypothetical protein